VNSIPHVVTEMTPFPYFIESSASLAKAQQLMTEHQIRHLPVYEDDDIAGIISERDIKGVCSPGHKPETEMELLVGDVCTYNPYVADVADPLDKVLEAMVEHHLGAILIMKEGEMAGIFTAQDACQLLAKTLQDMSDEEPEDIIA
jgi:CBS domain-containing protein